MSSLTNNLRSNALTFVVLTWSPFKGRTYYYLKYFWNFKISGVTKEFEDSNVALNSTKDSCCHADVDAHKWQPLGHAPTMSRAWVTLSFSILVSLEACKIKYKLRCTVFETYQIVSRTIHLSKSYQSSLRYKTTN